MRIKRKDIIRKVTKIDGIICREGNNKVRTMHVCGLRKKLMPYIKKYCNQAKNPGKTESRILDIAINYLIRPLGWTEGHLEGYPGYFIKS